MKNIELVNSTENTSNVFTLNVLAISLEMGWVGNPSEVDSWNFRIERSKCQSHCVCLQVSMQWYPSIVRAAQVEKTTLIQSFAFFVYPVWKHKNKNQFMTFLFFPVFIFCLKKINQCPQEQG